ncbi:MAG TPA: DUF3179 domain-containing protein, partial [Afifellaceae bacterium]|nr:DUF3179 domain-containing protein [Afifellaceae bacterium]
MSNASAPRKAAGFGIKEPLARIALAAFAVLTCAMVSASAQETISDKEVDGLVRSVFGGPPAVKLAATEKLIERGNPDIVPSLALALRFTGPDPAILSALSSLTASPIESWADAMLWQEAHPEVIPHPSFRNLKLEVLYSIDPRFARFLDGDKSKRENMKIRLEEIAWGGVRVDGIPSLDNPKLILVAEAGYLLDDDLVFGVAINGDARAYPLRIMGWHEMFNETIGGVPVALAYCTLCGAGILFETKVEGRDKPFVFGSSGFLYRSNKLMFDRETDSLWNQFTGKPVVGPLVGSGIELKIRPVTITSWRRWKELHPDTKVLSLETGHRRDYGSGVVYQAYFASPDLMFPTIVRNEESVRRKDFVFGIRDVAAAKAWPVSAFATRPVINDAVGSRNVVLIGDAETRT